MRSVEIYCITLGVTFRSKYEAAIYIGAPTATFSQGVRWAQEQGDKTFVYGEYVFKVPPKRDSYKIVCLTTGKTFSSDREAAESTNVNASTFSRCKKLARLRGEKTFFVCGHEFSMPEEGKAPKAKPSVWKPYPLNVPDPGRYVVAFDYLGITHYEVARWDGEWKGILEGDHVVAFLPVPPYEEEK